MCQYIRVSISTWQQATSSRTSKQPPGSVTNGQVQEGERKKAVFQKNNVGGDRLTKFE